LASSLNSLIEGLWGDICSVRPGDRSAFDARLLEEVQVPQRCKHRAFIQVFREIDIAAGPIVKNDVIAVPAFVSDPRDLVQVPHNPPL